ncbi:unnamed protein product [Effrenium voratum]|nr:unnamed protein product [Effrenium voratum]
MGPRLPARNQATARQARKKKKQELETFAFEPDEEDHCETPGSAYKHIVHLLREIAQAEFPEDHWRVASKKIRIYDPYYCQGGVKSRLARLGFENVYNENEDFYKVCAQEQVPGFDVLVTNPPFSADEHFAVALDFAIRKQKPWFMILPVHLVFRSLFVKATEDLPCRPFFLAPPKKYKFRTPAPLPPPKLDKVPCEVRSVPRAPETPIVSGAPGSLVQLPYEEAVAHIEQDLLAALRCADSGSYPLLGACEPGELLGFYQEVVQRGSTRDTWDAVMYQRISNSYAARRPELIWLDDKVAQVQRVSELLDCGVLHLPLLAHAAAENGESVEKMQKTLLEVAMNEPVVVKPRHGANSCFVSLWPHPGEIGEQQLLRSIEVAMEGEDHSWEKECWQLSQVPRGAIVQPMYAIAVSGHGPRSRSAPMELKVQVFFGRVVGATLNTHPQPLWVAWNGVIQLWDSQELIARGQVRCKSLDRCYGRTLPPELLWQLQEALASSWLFVRDTSERLCRAAGLDELRVDWLLGDAKWGPRIGELTYVGAGSRVTPPLAMRLAKAFAAGHLLRLRRLRLEEDSDAEPLWPLTAERGKKLAVKLENSGNEDMHHRLLEVAQEKSAQLAQVVTKVKDLPKEALPGSFTPEMRQYAEAEGLDI